MKCPKCEQKERQYKNGKTTAGSQRYRCHNCGYSYTPEKKVQGYSQAFRQKAIKMYVDGAGLRRTGRQLGIHHQTVANWAKEEAEQLPEAPMPIEVKTAELESRMQRGVARPVWRGLGGNVYSQECNAPPFHSMLVACVVYNLCRRKTNDNSAEIYNQGAWGFGTFACPSQSSQGE